MDGRKTLHRGTWTLCTSGSSKCSMKLTFFSVSVNDFDANKFLDKIKLKKIRQYFSISVHFHFSLRWIKLKWTKISFKYETEILSRRNFLLNYWQLPLQYLIRNRVAVSRKATDISGSVSALIHITEYGKRWRFSRLGMLTVGSYPVMYWEPIQWSNETPSCRPARKNWSLPLPPPPPTAKYPMQQE